MSFTNHVLELFNNTWRGVHKAYQAAAIGAKGREMQSYHRDIMKVPEGKRVVSVFAALDEDLYSVYGTNTVFLPHSRDGLPHPWDPFPIPLRRGDLFVLFSDLVHAGGCTPLSKPASWWRRVCSWALPRFRSLTGTRSEFTFRFGVWRKAALMG